MTKKRSIVIFNQKNVRRYWDVEKELWYFSVIDVIAILTDSTSPRRYWSDLKIKLKNEGSEVYEKIVQLKMIASDGKKYLTDCFATEDLLRVIQSIPSPRAEPFKVWLAKVGYERIEETDDPELVLNMLAEATTTEISKKKQPRGFDESRTIAREGGHVAGTARREIEQRTGEPVVSRKNAKRIAPKEKVKKHLRATGEGNDEPNPLAT